MLLECHLGLELFKPFKIGISVQFSCWGHVYHSSVRGGAAGARQYPVSQNVKWRVIFKTKHEINKFGH
jgi:hypothetical protein